MSAEAIFWVLALGGGWIAIVFFGIACGAASKKEPPRRTDCFMNNMFCRDDDRYCDTLVDCPNRTH